MGFDSKYFVAAENELSRIQVKNRRLEERRAEEIRTKCPEAAALDAKLRETTGRLLRLIADRSGDISEKLTELEKDNLYIQEHLRRTLTKHGYPADYLDPIYDCAVCRDTGIADGKRCSCFMENVKKAASEDMNRNSPLRLCSFDDFDLSYYDDSVPTPLGPTARKIMELNLKTCRSYAENFHLPCGGLLMRGKTGLGKTHLSLSIASAVIAKGYNVIYGSAPDIFRTIEREHFNRSSSDTDTLAAVAGADLLVLDDLGAEFDTKAKFCAHTLYNILNDRMNASLPTIISTNLEHSELEERYEERIFSRLSTMEVLYFTGSDVRVKKAGLK